jgi:hypothetical protein
MNNPVLGGDPRMTEFRLLAAAPPRVWDGPAPPPAAARDLWADLQAGLLHVFQTLAVVAVTAAVSCVAVRYLVPVALRVLMRPVQDAISLLATAAVLPEYLLTTVLRATGRAPLPAAYAFDDMVAWWARTMRGAAQLVLELSSRTARRMHPLITALIAGGIALRLAVGSW